MLRRLALAFLLLGVAAAQYAPLPQEIKDARTVYIENRTTSPVVSDGAYVELENWGRFKVIDDPKEAHLILRFSVSATEGVPVSVPLSGGARVSGVIRDYYITMDVISDEGKRLWSVMRPLGSTKNPKKSGAAKCVKEFRKRFPKEEQKKEKR